MELLNDKNQEQSEEELALLLLARKNIRPRFRWNIESSEAEKLLRAAYKAEVMARQMTYKANEGLNEMFSTCVKSLTAEKPRLGIMFCGTCGNGKTTMLKAIQSTTSLLLDSGFFEFMKKEGIKPSVEIIDAREFAEESKNADRMRYYKSSPVLAIEDMGKESAEVLNYGNSINPIMELIEARYDRQNYTIITTNLTAKEVSQKYGRRIADRFNEMLDVVIFKDGSYRR